ncbi:hypothetical protein WNY37_16635 [Henriciella sp. AS95]|uniref:hypothetical protein n=1 Tax=Henriciella sp. AS95 TaxID=3135782 RepID=UPI0031793316
MKPTLRQTVALALFAAAASPAFAQVAVSGDSAEMPGLEACLADAEVGDTAAIDTCVRANIDEIKAFIAANPKTAIDPTSDDQDEAEASE